MQAMWLTDLFVLVLIVRENAANPEWPRILGDAYNTVNRTRTKHLVVCA